MTLPPEENIISAPFINMPSRVTHSHQLESSTEAVLNTTFFQEKDPWRMIRKPDSSNPPRDLRLIIHGSSGGLVHPILISLVKQVKQLRQASVELEVLTKEEEEEEASNYLSAWVVPLLLLPGKHVQDDIPKIYKRLIGQGVKAESGTLRVILKENLISKIFMTSLTKNL